MNISAFPCGSALAGRLLLLLTLCWSLAPLGAAPALPDLAQVRAQAEQGDKIAQFNLGVVYAYGDGVARDPAEAVQWFRKAAEQNFAQAQLNLGVMFATGNGVIKDPVQAHAWWNVAAAGGDETARAHMKRIEADLTPDQKAEAVKLARELYEKTRPKETPQRE